MNEPMKKGLNIIICIKNEYRNRPSVSFIYLLVVKFFTWRHCDCCCGDKKHLRVRIWKI